MRQRATRLTAIAHAARRMLASVFDGAAAAYSLRIPAGSTYNGPLLRVRRSSDNAEADIGAVLTPDANGDRWLDTAALLAFVGAGSGFVTTWYEQRGNALHATQTNPALQPRIVNAGVLDTLGGRPSLRWLGVGTFLQTSISPLGGQDLYLNHVAAINTGAGISAFSRIISLGSPGVVSWSTRGHITSTLNKTGPNFGVENTDAKYTLGTSTPGTITFGSLFVYTFKATNAVHRGAYNGVITGPFLPLDPDTWTFTNIQIGRENADVPNTYLNGFISEVIIGTSRTDASLLTLERSQGAAFGITVA